MNIFVERAKRYQAGLRDQAMNHFDTDHEIKICRVVMTEADLMPQIIHGQYSLTNFFKTEADKDAFLKKDKERFEAFCNRWVDENAEGMGYSDKTKKVFVYDSVENIEKNHGGDYTWNLR